MLPNNYTCDGQISFTDPADFLAYIAEYKAESEKESTEN